MGLYIYTEDRIVFIYYKINLQVPLSVMQRWCRITPDYRPLLETGGGGDRRACRLCIRDYIVFKAAITAICGYRIAFYLS